MTIDPITLAVLAGRMEQIADEMDATLFRSAFNPIIAEAHDASHGLYHAITGETLVQGKSGLPIFVGVMAFAVKAAIDKAARDGDLTDGDIYIFNDAHLGGTHLSDMRLVRPYFHQGQVFCWLASVGHWHDVGGAVPGNYNPQATEVFQEAFVLPPVKLARAGVLQQDIVDILLRNTRLPASAQGDLNGQMGALDLGVKRLDALLEDLGLAKKKPAAAATPKPTPTPTPPPPPAPPPPPPVPAPVAAAPKTGPRTLVFSGKTFDNSTAGQFDRQTNRRSNPGFIGRAMRFHDRAVQTQKHTTIHAARINPLLQPFQRVQRQKGCEFRKNPGIERLAHEIRDQLGRAFAGFQGDVARKAIRHDHINTG